MTRIVIGAAAAVVLVSTVACGGGSASLSPAAPSVGASAQRLSATTVASTTQSDHGNRPNNAEGDEHGPSDKSEIEGRIASMDLLTHSIVVRGTTVHVLADTVIRHGHTTLTFNDLNVGTQVHVRGARNGTAVDARLIIVQDENGDEDEDGAKTEGAVAGLATTNSCPAITFKIGTTVIVTNAATVFRGVTCAQLTNGAVVEVRGAAQPNGSILASSVKVADDDEHDD